MTTAEIKRHSGIPSLFINSDAVVQMHILHIFANKKKTELTSYPPIGSNPVLWGLIYIVLIKSQVIF